MDLILIKLFLLYYVYMHFLVLAVVTGCLLGPNSAVSELDLWAVCVFFLVHF